MTDFANGLSEVWGSRPTRALKIPRAADSGGTLGPNGTGGSISPREVGRVLGMATGRAQSGSTQTADRTLVLPHTGSQNLRLKLSHFYSRWLSFMHMICA